MIFVEQNMWKRTYNHSTVSQFGLW